MGPLRAQVAMGHLRDSTDMVVDQGMARLKDMGVLLKATGDLLKVTGDRLKATGDLKDMEGLKDMALPKGMEGLHHKGMRAMVHQEEGASDLLEEVSGVHEESLKVAEAGLVVALGGSTNKGRR